MTRELLKEKQENEKNKIFFMMGDDKEGKKENLKPIQQIERMKAEKLFYKLVNIPT